MSIERRAMANTTPYTYFDRLVCSVCGREFDLHQLQTYCPDCNAPLLCEYDLQTAREELDRDQFRLRERGMWRWHELLPVFDPGSIVSLGEGDTPILPLPRLGGALGMERVFVKDESINPTGSFKARGLAAAVSKAAELGAGRLCIPTAGNAGGALAAYASRGGLSAFIAMPDDTPAANVFESRMTGADVRLVRGLISDAAKLVQAKAQMEEGWFDVSTFKEPYRVEGKKIMGYEIAETFGWKLPDVILYPTGGGTGLVGIWKAFAEMAAMGWLEDGPMPRMVAVQAAGCAPVVRAFDAGAPVCEFWENAQTVAYGLRVPKSFADRLILSTLKDSRGTAVAVSDAELLEAQAALGTQEGMFVAPEGAATFAALQKLAHSGWVQPQEKVLLLNTGSGIKYIA
jgi:threonine synthase